MSDNTELIAEIAALIAEDRRKDAAAIDAVTDEEMEVWTSG